LARTTFFGIRGKGRLNCVSGNIDSIVPANRFLSQKIGFCEIPHHWNCLPTEKMHLLLSARLPGAQTAVEIRTPIQGQREKRDYRCSVSLGVFLIESGTFSRHEECPFERP
jgi:hypothetical protein